MKKTYLKAKNLLLAAYNFGQPNAGKKVLIISGVHGGENTPIRISKKLIALLKTKKIKGGITIIPIVNPAGCKKEMRVNPVDKKNINSAGTQNKKKPKPYTISDAIADAIIDIAKNYDYFLDLHSASRARYLRHTYATTSRDLELARSFGANFVILVRDSIKASYGKYKTAIDARIRKLCKIPSFAQELGAGLKIFPEDVKFGFSGILSFLNEIGILQNIKKLPKTSKKMVFPVLREKLFYREKITKPGFIYFYKKIGERVKNGEILGKLVNSKNGGIENIKAKKTGLLIYQRIIPKIKKEEVGKEEFYKILMV